MKFEYAIRYLIYGIIVFTSFSIIEAQNPQGVEVEISTQKVMIAGKAYYLHTIKKGQTLYSIARAYQCTVNEILQENPNLTEDIKVDQVIKVPVKEKKAATNDKENEVLHTVMPGQTLFSISRMYGVNVTDIKSANQLSSDTVRVSQQLIIPVNRKVDSLRIATTHTIQVPSSTSDRFVMHRVQEGETLYSLSRKYGTTVDKILEANPDQRESLKLGAELKIPVSNIVLPTPAPTQNCDSFQFSINGKSISIALLLPFFANNQEIKGDEEEDNQETLSSTMSKESFPPVVMNFLEFYQGVLLGIEDLKKEGLNIELNVFDTEKGIEKINSIISQPAFQKSQLIIGPVFSEQISPVVTFSRENNIPLILPFTTADSLVQQTPQMFQVFSGQKGEIEQLIGVIAPDSIQNVFVVYNGKENQQINQLAHNLLETLQKNNAKSVREFYIYNYDFKDLLSSLDSTQMNHVVSFSNDEVFVASLLGQLEKKLLYYPIRTYGISTWLSFSSIDLNYFYNQQLTCFSNFYVDYEQEKVLRFLKKYRLRFGSEPVRNSKFGFNYCMLGYDLTRYFAVATACLGNNFAAYDCTPNSSLNVKLKFIPTIPSGGYINRAFYQLRFSKDFTFTAE
ncbi:MAG TPA: LysM peptidoglycan-binding domain-containing protein [Bacteroidales bacterium]|nr:LysM peptidoglycan-binding domain-containing protein [Bacteroidales bacterium]